MKRFILSTTICLLPAVVSAETRLERFEALSDQISAVMITMFSNEIEQAGGDASALRALDGMMPPWSDEIRQAADCILEEYVAETSSSAVDEMLDRMEEIVPTLATMTMTEATETGVLEEMTPQGLTDDRMMEINSACGMMELQMEASQKSGFMEAMMAAGSTVPDNN